jgi:glucan biosynthesis protein C
VAGKTPVLTPVDGHAHPLYALIYPLTAWSWSLALIGAGRLFLQKENPMIRRLSDASYWIYIIHVPVLLVFQWLMAPVDLDPVWKFFAVVLATLGVGLLSYQLLVRYSFVGTILNGRRRKAKRAAFTKEATA